MSNSAVQIHAVDIDADALIAGGLVAIGQDADAANIHDQRAVTRIERRNLQRRDGAIAQIDQRGHMPVDQVVIAHDRNGDRGFLQIFLTLLRRHDDFGQAAARIASGVRCDIGGGRRFLRRNR